MGAFASILVVAVLAMGAVSPAIGADCVTAERLYQEARDEDWRQVDSALGKAGRAAALCPDEVEYQRYHAHVLDMAGQSARGLEVLDAALLRWPTDGDLHYWRAMLLQSLGRQHDGLDAALVARSLHHGLAPELIVHFKKSLRLEGKEIVGAHEVMKAESIVGRVNEKGALDEHLVFRNITFESGSDVLQASALTQLRELASAFNTMAREGRAVAQLEIAGHCDRNPYRGMKVEESESRNRELSRRRADAVAAWLSKTAAGALPLSACRAEGRGFDQPFDLSETPEADMRNRRVVVNLKLATTPPPK